MHVWLSGQLADARQRDALLGRNHVDDSLVVAADVEKRDAGRTCRGAGLRDEFGSSRHARGVAAPRKGVDDVIHRAEHLFGIAHAATRRGQFLEGDAAGAFVQEDAVDVEEAAAAAEVGDQVLVPEFVDEGSRHCVNVAAGGGAGE